MPPCRCKSARSLHVLTCIMSLIHIDLSYSCICYDTFRIAVYLPVAIPICVPRWDPKYRQWVVKKNFTAKKR